MKTITYNPETHVLVPRDLIADAKQIFCSDVEPNTNGDCLDVIEWFNAMLASAPQPESVDVEPTAYLSIDSIGERYLCFSKPADNDSCYPLYTTPQHDRTAELEAVLKVARDALNDCEGAMDESYDTILEALAKINEVLK